MARGLVLLASLAALGFVVVLGNSVVESQAKAKPGSLLPFEIGTYLPVESESSMVRLEDLKVEAGGAYTSCMGSGRREARATIGVKNLTQKHIYVAVCLALFDAEKNLVCAGNRSNWGEPLSFADGDKLPPRTSVTKEIYLGYPNLKHVRYYSYRVHVYVAVDSDE